MDRYGIEEVSQWYFEVWNEPNLDFWAGKPAEETYYQLYDVTAQALKSVNARLARGRAGNGAGGLGRSLCAPRCRKSYSRGFCFHACLRERFGERCLRNRRNHFAHADGLPRCAESARSGCSIPRPDLPIIWSEYNASYKNETAVTDSIFMGPWLADTIRQCDGLAEMMAYWTFSDVFEEQGVVKQPFYGGFGLIAEDGLPKPSFNAFKLIASTRRKSIARRYRFSDCYPAGRRHFGNGRMESVSPEENGQPKKVTIVLKGLPRRHRAALVSPGRNARLAGGNV